MKARTPEVIGEDVSEKHDYTPGVSTVELHIRGKGVCDDCEALIPAPVSAQVSNKRMPTASVLAYRDQVNRKTAATIPVGRWHA